MFILLKDASSFLILYRIDKMPYKLETDQGIYMLDSETKPSTLTVHSDKDSSLHIAHWPPSD